MPPVPERRSGAEPVSQEAGDLTKARKLTRVLTIGALTQIVGSGTNFAFGLYLVRALEPPEFGLYGIGFAVAMTIAGIASALWLTQMVVHLPTLGPNDRMPYASRMLVVVALFCLLTVILCGGLVVIGHGYSAWIARHGDTIMAIGLAMIGITLKDFFIRHAYSIRTEAWALWINVGIAVALAGLLAGTVLTTGGVSAEGALLTYAGSNIAGALVGGTLAGISIRALEVRAILDDARQAWRGGSWAMVGTIAISVQSQAYVYLTALIVGPIGVGLANAARLFIMPVAFVVPAVAQIALPRLIELDATDRRAMLRIGVRMSAALISVAAIYSAVLLPFTQEIASRWLGASYHSMTPLVAAWCLVLVLLVGRNGVTVILHALRDFRAITFDVIVGAVATIAAGVGLMIHLGVVGSVLGLALGELILGLLLFRRVYLHRSTALSGRAA